MSSTGVMRQGDRLDATSCGAESAVPPAKRPVRRHPIRLIRSRLALRPARTHSSSPPCILTNMDNATPQTPLQIDTASVHELVALFRHATIADAKKRCEWYWKISHEVTVQILNVQDIHFGLAQTTGVAGAFETLSEGLLLIGNSPRIVPEGLQKDEFAAAIEWASRHREKVKEALASLKANETFRAWTDDSRRYNWVEHRQRTGRLYTEKLLPVIAYVRNQSAGELKKTLKRTEDARAVEAASKSETLTEEYGAFLDAYFVSALVRGRAYDAIGRGSKYTPINHPFRQRIIDRFPGIAATFDVEPLSKPLACIIIGDAFLEGTFWRPKSGQAVVPDEIVIRRIKRWLQSVRAARNEIRNNPRSGATVDGAVDVALRAGIQGVPRAMRLMEKHAWFGLQMTAAYAGYVLTTQYHLGNHLPALVALAIVAREAKKTEVKEMLTRQAQELKRKYLRELAKYPSGRLEREESQE